jgi:hypothetical protein
MSRRTSEFFHHPTRSISDAAAVVDMRRSENAADKTSHRSVALVNPNVKLLRAMVTVDVEHEDAAVEHATCSDENCVDNNEGDPEPPDNDVDDDDDDDDDDRGAAADDDADGNNDDNDDNGDTHRVRPLCELG